jgi:hypothetical protein
MMHVACAVLTAALAAGEAKLHLEKPEALRLIDPQAHVPSAVLSAPAGLGTTWPVRARGTVNDVLVRSSATFDRELSERLPKWLVVSGSRAIKLAATGYLANEMRKLRTFRTEDDEPVRRSATGRERAQMAERVGGASVDWSFRAAAVGLGVLAAGGGLLWWEAEHPGEAPFVNQIAKGPSAEGPMITGLRVSLAGEGPSVMLRGRW